MRIVTLVENTKERDDLGRQHGLSFYIETQEHRLLFDLGQDELFLENAKKLDIDITAVDTVVISHGHYDHGGGLKAFLEKNHTAKIYVQEHAFEAYYSQKLGVHVPIGLSKSLENHPQIIHVGDQYVIDKQLQLFSGIKGRHFFSSSNRNLMTKCEGKYIPDAFSHEQALVITENEKHVLLAGCAHNGIVNILDKAEAILKDPVDVAIGGLHLYSPGSNHYESDETIHMIADNLCNRGGMYYTCHCTGQKAYELLKEDMKDHIAYLATGSEITI